MPRLYKAELAILINFFKLSYTFALKCFVVTESHIRGSTATCLLLALTALSAESNRHSKIMLLLDYNRQLARLQASVCGTRRDIQAELPLPLDDDTLPHQPSWQYSFFFIGKIKETRFNTFYWTNFILEKEVKRNFWTKTAFLQFWERNKYRV